LGGQEAGTKGGGGQVQRLWRGKKDRVNRRETAGKGGGGDPFSEGKRRKVGPLRRGGRRIMSRQGKTKKGRRGGRGGGGGRGENLFQGLFGELGPHDHKKSEEKG